MKSNNILTFAPNRTFIHAILNAPGSWNDLKIAERLLPAFPVEFTCIKLMNKPLVYMQQADEWGIQAIQSFFSRFKLPLPGTDHEFLAEVLELCVSLHQVQFQSVKIKQTQNMYQSAEDHHIFRIGVGLVDIITTGCDQSCFSLFV
ncbi:uncharacterized protein VP01_6701g1 [Puccinia sorghi]|uniref:Uncharacterized protein n=1 Tax=Puccinia sorghi TaxID=27349 RepID=A0A0L6UFL9_9BASI|nr:uncharacterized protein VP01_6701g1 [Puccinia sorghi]